MQSTCLRPHFPAITRPLLHRGTNLILKTLPKRTIESSSPMSVVSEWKGIDIWRAAPIDKRRSWGQFAPMLQDATELRKRISRKLAFESGDVETISTIDAESDSQLGAEGFDCRSLASWGALVLITSDPLTKARITHEAYCMWKKGKLQLGVACAPRTPGRPAKPELVPPRQVPSPKDCGLGPSAHLLHNLAHIELNAIDLAWDTLVRFSNAREELGREFYDDFLHVADDESRHFTWCSQRLNELGFSYGDMPAHNLLWEECMKTSGSVKSRLAVIPMIQEARGLDAGPRLVNKLLGLNDHRSAAIVRRIGQEEVAHVNVGVFHFLRICERLGVEPGDEFKEVISEYQIQLRGPFNHSARRLAGLQRHWYDNSESHASGRHRGILMAKKVSGDGNSVRMGGKFSPWVASPKSAQEDDRKIEEKPTSKSPTVSGDAKEGLPQTKGNGNTSKSALTEVFERLELLVAMEKSNAGIE